MSTRCEFDRARTPLGLAHVEAEDAIDVGMRGEHGKEVTPDESGGAGDRDGMHPHTLTAWPTRLNPETPRSPTNPRVPGLPPFLFGGPGGNFDPANVRLLADRPEPGDADPAVDRTRQLGGRAPDRRVGRARGSARARRSRRATASSSRSSRTRRRPSWSARPGSPRRSPPRSRPSARRAGSTSTSSRSSRCSRRWPPRSAPPCSRTTTTTRGSRRGARRPARLRGHAVRGDGRDGRHGQHDVDARARAARRAGGLDDRLPRAARARSLRPAAAHRAIAPSLCFVVANIDTFESEWSLPRDDLRFYVALHETVHAAARSVPWVRERLVRAGDAVRVELRDRPVGVRSRVRDDRSAGPGVAAAAHREPGAGARRDAVGAPGRARARSCSGSRR